MTDLRELTGKIRRKRIELIRAMGDKNMVLTDQYTRDLTILNGRLADVVMDVLERQRYANANNSVCSCKRSDVEVSDNPATNFGSVGGGRTE